MNYSYFAEGYRIKFWLVIGFGFMSFIGGAVLWIDFIAPMLNKGKDSDKSV